MLQIYSLVDESKRKIGYRLKTDIGVFDMPIQLEPVGGFNNIAGQIEVRKDSFGDYASAEEYGLSKDKKIPNLGANEYLKNLVTQHIGIFGDKLGFRVFLGDKLVKETPRYSCLGTREDVLNAVIAKRQAVNPNWKPQPDLLAELESSKNDNFIYNIQCISAEEFLLNLSKYAGDVIDVTNYFD